jgi:probable rRNA maturation factor
VRAVTEALRQSGATVGGVAEVSIVLTDDAAQRQLNRQWRGIDKPFDHHFTHLVVHGFLHLIGYDHVEESDALQMEGLETQILARLGVPDPYEEG